MMTKEQREQAAVLINVLNAYPKVFPDTETSLASMLRAGIAASEECERLRETCAGFVATVEAAEAEWANEAAGRPGMQVPFRGDFGHGLVPSAKSRLSRWKRAFQEVLK